MKDKLVAVFLKHDPMQLGVIENNLLDEYDAEVELVLENIENLERKDKKEVEDLLEFVFVEMFEEAPVFADEFINEVLEAIS